MLRKILKHKMVRSVFLLVLISIFVFGYLFLWDNQNHSVGPGAKVMYLVPEDETQVEELVKSETLVSQTDIWIETISDWGQISRLVADEKVYAVIIHHTAVNQVNLEELQHLIQNKRLVVATIGIPADQLSEMMGELPSFYDESFANSCKASLCYVIYSSREANGIVEVMPPDDVKDQLDLGMATRTDANLLISEDDSRMMLRLIKSHVWEMQRDYRNDNKQPTLTFSEVEELLGKQSEN